MSDFASFLVFFLDIPERKFPGGGGESPQALSIRRPLAGVSDLGARFCTNLQGSVPLRSKNGPARTASPPSRAAYLTQLLVYKIQGPFFLGPGARGWR